jgi:MFS family permease
LIPLSVGGAILRPLLNSLLTQQVPAERSGAALGISAAVISAMNALAPLVGGGLFALNPAYPFGLGVASCVVGCAVFVILTILSARKHAPQSI